LLRDFRPEVELLVVSHNGEVDQSFEPCMVVKSFEAGLDSRPDAVIIASISASHGRELMAVLSLGLPCLAEKPLVIHRSELQALALAWEGAPIKPAWLVGCNLRYMPSLRKWRSQIADGVIGSVVRAQFEVGQDLALWRPSRNLWDSYSAKAVDGGGVVCDLVHEIDMAVHTLGPLSVLAAASGKFGALPIESIDVSVSLMKTSRGVPVTIALDYVSRQLVRRYSAVGTEGSLTWDMVNKTLTLETLGQKKEIAAGMDAFDMAATYRAQMLDWLQAMADRAHVVLSPMEDALGSTAAMLDILEAGNA
jgi:predicted dehydrogenase